MGIFGYSRKDLSDEDLRNIVAATLTCRVDHQFVPLSITKFLLCNFKFQDFFVPVITFFRLYSLMESINIGQDFHYTSGSINWQERHLFSEIGSERVFLLQVVYKLLKNSKCEINISQFRMFLWFCSVVRVSVSLTSCCNMFLILTLL